MSSPRSLRGPVLLAITITLAMAVACSMGKTKRPQDHKNLSHLSGRVDASPIRGKLHPLRLRKAEFTYRCSECHRSFDTKRGPKHLMAEHEDIVLNHGRNNDCQNCHHTTNRDVFVAHDGSEIPADHPEQLCAKCHGPTYRDWEAGVHGRRNGFWKTSMGAQQRLACTQCHDPHQPHFASLAPLPGPRAPRGAEKEARH